jgi:CRISPR-associated protein Csb2
VLALTGTHLSLPATLKLTETLRGAILATCPEPIPEWVSGHTSDGKPSSDPHLALLPLPFVGYEHADGRLIGVAVALPKGITSSQTAHCLGPWLRDEHGLPRRNKLFAGQWFECGAELETRETPPATLRSDLWTRPSRIWASVTPVVLDRHFDGKDKWERAAETVKDACERIGLPRPKEMLLHPVSLVEGVPHAREFPYLTRRKDGGRMHHTHAVIVFDVEVTGPIMVGAGRFRGYGLCRPIMARVAAHE